MSLLLDIAEPGQSLLPHQSSPLGKRLVVGIDLGTTFSLVAAIASDGSPACIPDEEGEFSLPSVVHYGPSGIGVGRAAEQQAVSAPQETIFSVKRLMGRGLADLAEVASRLPYRLEPGEGGMVRLLTQRGSVSPVEVSAEILKVLKERAEEALGGPLHGAVITVPAYFDDAQRQATKDAGRLAGLEVMRLVNEPTAAALAYGLDQAREGMFAIYDLGGGTFDISILKLSGGIFQVMSTGGNSALGGDDLDRALADLLLRELDEPITPQRMEVVRSAARQAKESLSQVDAVTITLPRTDGTSFIRPISRNEFDDLIRDLVKVTGNSCRRALKDAGVTAAELAGVVLVGGSTRVPLVRQMVREWFGQEPLCDLDPDQVVALGAAHQADLLAGSMRSDLLLLDVTPLSLGVETMGGLVERIVPRNTPIPTAMAQEFTTFKDGQTAMAIHVVQGERELVAECRSLARFELRGIPPMTAGAARILVTYRVDADGLLTVSAREQATGLEQSVAVKPSYGLTDAEIEQMLRDALEHGAEDMMARVFNETKVEAERLLHAVSAAIKQDGDLLTEEELAQLRRRLREVWESTQGKDHELIRQAMARLDQESQPFAQRRMDRGIREAMTGHRVDEFG